MADPPPLTPAEILAAFKNASPAEKKELAGAFAAFSAKKAGSAAAAGVSRSKSFIENKDDIFGSATAAFESTERLSGPISAIFDSFRNFREESKAFFESGYTGQMDGFAKAISAANVASHKLNASFTAAKAATTAFRDNFRGMIFASTQMQESLMKTSVVMHGAGWDLNQYASIVESATMAFNKTETEVENMTATLLEVQKTLAVSPKELAKNFRTAQQNMGYSAKKIEETFIGLQKMSRTTGVSFDKLAGAFGKSMDKFGGSAQKAGQLNQILGKSVFNSMELLNMTEKERAEKIRGAIMESGRSVKEMGKFELLALNETLGFNSVEDTRKFLRGDLAMGAGPGGAYQRMKDAKIKPSEDIKTQKLETALEEMTKGIRGTRPPLLDFQINLKSALYGKAREHLLPKGPWTARGQTADQAMGGLQAHTLYGARAADQFAGGRRPGIGYGNAELFKPMAAGLDKGITSFTTFATTFAKLKVAELAGLPAALIGGPSAAKTVGASAMESVIGSDDYQGKRAEYDKQVLEMKRGIQGPQGLTPDHRARTARAAAYHTAAQGTNAQSQASSPAGRLLSANERTATAIESLVNMARQGGDAGAGVGD
jgi:hypothetical protein